VINSNWHLISYRFGVIAAYCSNSGHCVFGSLEATYNVHLRLMQCMQRGKNERTTLDCRATRPPNLIRITHTAQSFQSSPCCPPGSIRRPISFLGDVSFPIWSAMERWSRSRVLTMAGNTRGLCDKVATARYVGKHWSYGDWALFYSTSNICNMYF